MLSSDERQAYTILSKHWKELPIDDVMKRYIKIGMLLFLEKTSSPTPFERWAAINYDKTSIELKGDDEVVRKLARKHSIRRQELTVNQWKTEIRRVLTSRWKNMKQRERNKWIRMQSPSSSGIDIRDLSF